MGTIKTTNIEPIADNGTVTLGSSGDTFTIPSGVTMVNNGTQTGFGGTNTPAFKAYVSTGMTIANATLTKITFQTEMYDTANAYDNSSNYRFQPQTAGKYFFTSKLRMEGTGFTSMELRIRKNGSTSFSVPDVIFGSNHTTYYDTYELSGVLEANGSSDYFEVFSQQNSGGNLSLSASFGTSFEAYRILT